MNPGILLAALVLELSAGEPATAEYAFRWNPKDGGPTTVEDIHRILGGKTKSVKEFAVRYHQVALDKKWPAGSDVAFRERTKADGGTDYRLKFRRATPFESLGQCPAGMEVSYEKDVSFGAAGATRIVYSLSCTTADADLARSLKTLPYPCRSEVVRHEGKKYRIEDWKLPGDERLLEISDKSENEPANQARFATIVERLLRSGAKPSTTSKTDMGTRCTE